VARVRLGWLGPAIVLVGAAIAALGVWYLVYAKPVVGDAIDTIAMEGDARVVIRAEDGGERSFVEVWDGDTKRWQALVPHYIGSPAHRGIAWSPTAITVRVDRGGRAEVFALAARDAAKLGGFRLAPEHEPIRVEANVPITVTDHVRAYELVGGDGWHEVIAVDLKSGRALWKTELGPEPVRIANLIGGVLVIYQSTRRVIDVDTGAFRADAARFLDFQF
jgi:hypothetical protein